MHRDERDIFHYDAVSLVWNRKYKSGLPPFPHYELARGLEAIFLNGDAAVYRSKDRATYISEIVVKNDSCEILVGFTDPNAADPTINNHAVKSRKTVNLINGDGIEHSAHIVWRYGNKTNSGPCLFLLEGAVGLSSAAVAVFFNTLLRLLSKSNPQHFLRFDPTGAMDAEGNFVTVRARPSLELRGHPSSQFISDLQGGEISELELITKAGAAKVWDANGYAIEDHESVYIKPNPAKLLPKAKKFVDGVLGSKVKQDYEESRVVFKTAGGIRKSVKFYTKNYQLINDLKYVKKTRIEKLGGNLPNAFGSFHNPILTKMRSL